jgi:hypothetical protein
MKLPLPVSHGDLIPALAWLGSIKSDPQAAGYSTAPLHRTISECNQKRQFLSAPLDPSLL